MKKFTLTLTTLAVAATSAVASSYVTASKVDMDVTKVGTKSKVWEAADATSVTLYPQTTITFNDKNAVEQNSENVAKHAQVKAIYDGKNVAFMLKLSDPSYNSVDGTKTDTYPDGFAMQFSDATDANALPYIGMGSDGRPVVVHLQKAVKKHYEPNGNGDVAHQVNPGNTNKFGKELSKFDKAVDAKAMKKYQRAFVAEGFRSTTEIKDGSADFQSNMRWANGEWYATLTRPMSDDYVDLEGAFPVAFAVWDGEKLNRDGLKHISSWTAVDVAGQDANGELVTTLTTEVTGDAAKGQKEFDTNCASCHRYGDKQMAPEYMAPNLSNIGGYSTAAYLKESITDPHAVVVPGYNRNMHPNFKWYTVTDGKRMSTMPAYGWLGEEKINDIVAFLKTLKKEAK